MRSPFDIKSENEFVELTLQTFAFQAENCAVYKQFLHLIGCNPSLVTSIEQIPFMPIELFKSQKVYSSPLPEQMVFTSSGTAGVQSNHFVADLSLYEESFTKGFHWFYPDAKNYNFYALLPSYLEREGSSLIYMVDSLIKNSADGGFYLYNYAELVERLKNRDTSRKSVLFGVSFALLELCEQFQLQLGSDVVVMETGGMKGRRRELPREELHQILCNGLGVTAIHSEYGMCECLSQSYSSGDGIFFSPPWMRIIIRSLGDPAIQLGHNRRGGVNIIDLANRNSLSFIQTQDKGESLSGNSFRIDGRIDYSDVRGCNLLI